MEKTNRQKAKLLLLMEMLRQDSDAQNPLKTHQLLEKLADKGISCDRRTLARDIVDLKDLGYEVMSVMCGHEKGYFLDDRNFSVPELRILMDAVQAARFIPKGKSDELTEKIAALGGSHRSRLLRDNAIHFNSQKHSNEGVFCTVSALEQALSQKQKISFLYFDLNEEQQKIYRKNGERYEAEPIGMVLLQDKYYLTALCPDRQGISIYRIDRMEAVQVLPVPVTAEAIRAKRQVTTLTRDAFKMYLGRTEIVTLVFEDRLTGYIYDHFGESVKVVRVDECHCRARVRVQISPAFFGWVLQFGPAMVLTGPEQVVSQVQDFIEKLPYGAKAQ